MAQQNDDESGLGQYRQRVTVEFEVMVHVSRREGDDAQTFNDVTTDDLRRGIERWVEEQMTGLYAQPLVGAKRGPGDSRYFFPSEGPAQLDRRPFWIGLNDLNIPTTDKEAHE